MLGLIKKSLLLVVLTICTINAKECQSVGGLNVFYDPSCASGGPGCNAGGQDPNCRFCG